MKIEYDSTIPIYMQIAESIEEMILEGSLEEGQQVPSTNQLAEYYKLNPATARKGLAILVDNGIIYKRRGVGMFVNEGAVKEVRTKRKNAFVSEYVTVMVEEARRLNITTDELIHMIEDLGRRKS